jgi:uncharacterized membrane protein YdcZ (DUF606 family)
VDDYLLKPFNPEDLVVAVRSRVDRLRAVREAHNQDQEQLKRKIMDILNHEFRTPLTFVVAYADMLGEIPSSDTPMANQEMLSFLEGVRGGADRLRRLVENFMLLIEIQTGNAERMYHFRRRAIPNIAPLIQEGVQRALNGQINEYSKASFTTSLLNFFMGTSVLALMLFALLIFNGDEIVPLPSGPWWIYTGGTVGVIYIAFTSTIVQHLGVLTFTLFSVGGTLIGSLLIDLISPTNGNTVSWYLVSGILMTYLGVVIGGQSRLFKR